MFVARYCSVLSRPITKSVCVWVPMYVCRAVSVWLWRWWARRDARIETGRQTETERERESEWVSEKSMDAGHRCCYWLAGVQPLILWVLALCLDCEGLETNVRSVRCYKPLFSSPTCKNKWNRNLATVRTSLPPFFPALLYVPYTTRIYRSAYLWLSY